MNPLFKHLSFTKEHPPVWPCPSCEHGRLHLVKDALTKSENAWTKIWKKDEECDVRDGTWHFSAQWLCDHVSCAELVRCIGEASWEQSGEEHDESGTPYPVDAFIYRPHFLAPAFALFTIPKKTPEPVAKALKTGFQLVFADSNAAANQLRTSLEHLLDTLKVNKRIKINPRKPLTCPNCKVPQTNGKPAALKTRYQNLSLHQRIEKLPERHKKMREELLAMKWLGNAGSHASGIPRKYMLTGYEIMERCLERLFDDKHAALDLQIKVINQSRGKLETKRSRPSRRLLGTKI